MRPQVPIPCLCLVTDRTVGAPDSLVERVAAAVAGGVDMVQVREKDLPGARLLELANTLKDAVGECAAILVNERVDVAAAAGVSGVQLGEEALGVAAARRILGDGCLVGRSVHSLTAAEEAAAQGADFLIVGTMYSTRSHPGALPAGPELMRNISSHCRVPLIGIGGINESNLGEMLRAGASGVAVITSILNSDNPEAAARRLKTAMLAALDDEAAISSEGVRGGPRPR